MSGRAQSGRDGERRQGDAAGAAPAAGAARRRDLDRALLRRLAQGPRSGAALGRELRVSRSAIWKRIVALRQSGIAIAAARGRGYALAEPLGLLDPAAITLALSPAVRARLGALEVLWEVDSTNSQWLRRRGLPQHSVLLAERQTGGRGRRGRAWVSPLAANLYLSLLRRFEGGLGAMAGLSLAVGVALAEALAGLGIGGIGLKWPNDLLRDGCKLGGVLIEFAGEAGGAAQAVIGIGLNVRMPAVAGAAIDQDWIDLGDLLPAPADRNRLAAVLLEALLPALDRFEAEGLAPFLPRWQRLDALAGREVLVLGDGEPLPGRVLGVTDDGALRVAHAQGERRHYSAEVSLRAQGSATP